jgi:hypothetical protein
VQDVSVDEDNAATIFDWTKSSCKPILKGDQDETAFESGPRDLDSIPSGK